MKLIGIDLGTTNSAIAVVNEFGKAEIIPNKEGERITPSVVMFDDDQIIVGSIAKQSSVAEPDRTVSSIKTHMGSADFVFEYKGNEYKPEDISAMIIRKLIEDAESYLNEKITDVVITVPAYFNDSQRKSTIDSGRISGVNVSQIINEPTAAALTYGFDKTIDQKIMVYDLGGGTFDVTIMHINNGNYTVIASDGDRQLGGNNFDEKLMIYLNDKFKQQHDTDLFEDPVLIQDLRLKSENAKKVLSSKLSTTVYLSAKGKSARVTVTRKLFADLIDDFVTRTELLMNAVMTDSALDWKDIDQILLVGGSTRIPSVCDMIFRVTGKKPSTQVNPDEAVSLGAAIQAGMIVAKDQNENVNDMVRMKYGAMNVSDVTAHSFGAITLDEFDNKRNAIIIPKNSKIPVRKSQIFYTSSANQTQVKMVVIQGEDPDPEFCTTIGTTTLDFPPKPENSPVIFNYEYDVNGIIHATAKDPDTGKKSEIQIAREGALTKDEISQKKKNINSMFPRRREYLAKESFTEENGTSPEDKKTKETGANLVSDVFVSAGVSETESFVEKSVYKPEIKQSDEDDKLLERSEMDTVTSDDLKKEIAEESAILDTNILPEKYEDNLTDPETGSGIEEDLPENSGFIQRFDDEISKEEDTDDMDQEIEGMFSEEGEEPTGKPDETESFDESLDELTSSSEEKAQESPDADDDDVSIGTIEKDEPQDDFEHVSVEDSSISESQSFDDELDEIGKSEFVIDRSEYLTDEDIIRIKEEANFKSGYNEPEKHSEPEESFTENEIKDLFSSKDSKEIDLSEELTEDKKKEAEKKPAIQVEDDITDWIDD